MRKHAVAGVRRSGTRAASRYGLAAVASFVLVVVLFASVNAFRSRPAPLSNTLPSPEAVAEAVVAAMQAGDVEGLRELALTEDEFRAHVWPELPISRPEVNAPFEFVWGSLHEKSERFLGRTVEALRGRSMDVKAVAFTGEASEYGDVEVHRSTELVIAGDAGDQRVRLFGSMIEQNGAWKVFSYVVED
jgi:hypothetical protein